MAAGAFAGIAVSPFECHFWEASILTNSQEHTVMYPIDLLKVRHREIPR